MCTLSYLPRPGGYIFTHNRDERSDRPTSQHFRMRQLGDHSIYYPEDLEAHGSWFAASDRGHTVCLLNGGSKPYERNPPYRHSRGLLPLAYFSFADSSRFYREYDFSGIEPFTMIIRGTTSLHKLTHDLADTRLEELDPEQNGIWSSTTLYSEEVRQKRERWFENWLAKKPPIKANSLRRFHRSAGDGDGENDLIMSRWGILQTLSITQVAVRSGRVKLCHEDLLRHSRDQRQLPLR